MQYFSPQPHMASSLNPSHTDTHTHIHTHLLGFPIFIKFIIFGFVYFHHLISTCPPLIAPPHLFFSLSFSTFSMLLQKLGLLLLFSFDWAPQRDSFRSTVKSFPRSTNFCLFFFFNQAQKLSLQQFFHSSKVSTFSYCFFQMGLCLLMLISWRWWTNGCLFHHWNAICWFNFWSMNLCF